jgi:hypothetical protein
MMPDELLSSALMRVCAAAVLLALARLESKPKLERERREPGTKVSKLFSGRWPVRARFLYFRSEYTQLGV